MDLLEKIQCQPYDLKIEIDEIEYGWMNITLISHYAFKKYAASYLCDPINDLLEKFSSLCEGKSYKVNPFHSIINFAVIEHDLEGQNIIWLLRIDEENLYVYIWENIYEIDDWLFSGFSEKYYIENQEEVPNLAKNLIFSLKGKMPDFAKTLIQTLDWLKIKGTELKLTNQWGYKFSESEYQKIKMIVEPNGNCA